ncbi:MAG: transcriptional repressor LexA [Clostridia bacterium]|nr:transcriptional repressor LexA [Clostridia bacterium]
MKREIISEKLNNVYNFIVSYTADNGFPPAIREVCDKLNIKSTATAYSYIEKLKSQGLLDKTPLKKRSLVPTKKQSGFNSVPLIGTVTAGLPIFAVENLEGYCPLPDEFTNSEDCFALRVSGESMINAGIYDKDIIIVKKSETAENGEIIVALIDDSATVKRFYKKYGKIILHPENDSMKDMFFDELQILGIVKGLIRKL